MITHPDSPRTRHPAGLGMPASASSRDDSRRVPRTAGASAGVTRHALMTAALMAVALASPANARAQERLDVVRVGTESMAAASRADALDSRAAAYEISYRNSGDLRRAAALRETAAGLRTPTDPRATGSLVWAALGHYYVGEKDAAGALMEAAAKRAAAMGDVVRAVDAYMDAATISAELGRSRHAADLVEQAAILTGSPLLSAAQRQALQRRVAQVAPAPAAVTAAVARR